MNQFNENGSYNAPNFVNTVFTNQYHSNLPDDGAVWFVAFAPLFSLVLSFFSGSKSAAIILWIFTYFLCVTLCSKDIKQLEGFGYNTSGLKQAAFIPVVYLFMRNSATANQKMYGFVCAFLTGVALLYNNLLFTHDYTEEEYIALIQETKCYELTDFEDKDGISKDTVSEVLNDYVIDGKISWNCVIGKKVQVITAQAEIDFNGKSSDFEIEFELLFDGFASDGIHVSDIKIDGDSLSDEERWEILMDIFND